MNIFDCTIEDLQKYFEEKGEKSFRAKQVFKHIYEGLSFDEMTDVSKKTRQMLSEDFDTFLPTIERKLVSKIDKTVKYLFKLCDGNVVEGVIMRYKHGISMCVSTQVGCSMGCTFCASTLKGKIRNLYPGEILGQIMAAKKDLGERISNIVLMGSGEPFDNYDNVMKFIRITIHPDGLGIGARHITLSTCGIADKIREFAMEGLQVNLSLSLHATTDEKRKEIMPVANKYSIKELLDACRYYIIQTGRRISFEFALIAGVNDDEETALALAKLLRGMIAHVNLIPVNEIVNGKFKKSRPEDVDKFMNILNSSGIVATVRRELGSDIDAACGQLRQKHLESKE